MVGVIVHVSMPVCVFCAARVYCGINKHMNDAQLIMRLYHYTMSEVKARYDYFLSLQYLLFYLEVVVTAYVRCMMAIPLDHLE